MIRFFELALANLAVASLIAALAWSSGRWLRRPALTHGLWTLVLLKLVTPPLIALPVLRFAADVPSAQQPQPQAAPMPVRAAQRDEGETGELAAILFEGEARPDLGNDGVGAQPASPPRAPEAPIAASVNWTSCLLGALIAVWVAGSIGWFSLAAMRLVRFARWIGKAPPAPAALQRRVDELAAALKTSAPKAILAPGIVSPMLWVEGAAPRLIVPADLLPRLEGQQGDSILLHELAHWKRGDHWIRRLETLVLGLWWWCPLVWWAKRRIEECEEECCDAWVVSTIPEGARDYAVALVETLEFLAGACPALPPAASGLGRLTSLRRRLTMILRGPLPHALTVGGVVALLGVGALLLPIAPTRGQTEEIQKKIEKALQALRDDQDPAQPKKDRPNPGRKEGGDRPEANAEIREMMEKVHQLEAETEQIRQELMRKMRMMMELRARAMQLQGRGPEGLPPEFRPPVPPQPGGAPGVPRDVERRLSELEGKLDMILRALRRDGDNPPPPRGERKDGERKDAPPPPRGDRKEPPAKDIELPRRTPDGQNLPARKEAERRRAAAPEGEVPANPPRQER